MALCKLICSMHYIRRSRLTTSHSTRNLFRTYSTEKEKKTKSSVGSKKYADSLNLPFTSFPLSMKNVSATEMSIQEHQHFIDLYQWQRNDKTRTEEFVLHDGPPYANGDIHVGHTLNKIVKDITNRYKVLRGYKVDYKPGWDCHGLPIELKALKSDGNNDPMYIRQKASRYAMEAAARQQTSFARLGVMAGWKEQCYFTDSPSYQTTQLGAFWELYEKGFIFQDDMPVYWSPSSRTAIAEAELEYNTEHISEAIHLRFRMESLPDCLTDKVAGDEAVFALVWTTTPWTIPANKAICYSSHESYILGRCLDTGNLYIMGAESLPQVELDTGLYFTELTRFEGHSLKNTKYRHPLGGATCPMLPGGHVTMDRGTGLVHTAPAHGHDDHEVALKHGVSVKCEVDELGLYTHDVGHGLSGKCVLGDGNTAVLELLSSDIVHQTSFKHSYPYDWRTNEPVMIRSSRQWFIDTRQIRERAKECMSSVRVTPPAMTQAMTSLLESRSRWCISRQRVWGVPIPVFYHPVTRQPVVNKTVIDHVISLVEKHGSDCWWSMSRDLLLPKHVLKQAGLDPTLQYEQGKDIFDIWFDSGISWKSVLSDDSIADVYAEGIDQFRGWFQAALLTSVALRDKAPYKNLLVHGFTVDEEGKKMSKSRGNVIDPHVIMDGGKVKFQNSPLLGYGADVLRWWGGRQYLQSNVHLGLSVLNDAQKQVFKLRKTLRFLLGNLYDVTDTSYVSRDLLWPVDRYMLSLIQEFRDQITESYDMYDYPGVLLNLEKFVNVQVSSFYLAVIKDRLYCDLAEGQGRRSCQTVLRHLYDVIVMVVAPVLPHLVEEANAHDNKNEQSNSVFHKRWSDVTSDYDVIDDVTKSGIDAVLSMKEEMNTRTKSDDPVLYDVTVMADDELYDVLLPLTAVEDDSYCTMTEILQCSRCRLLRGNESETETADVIHGRCEVHTEGGVCDVTYTLRLEPSRDHRCERCRRHTARSSRQPCQRCLNLLVDTWT